MLIQNHTATTIASIDYDLQISPFASHLVNFLVLIIIVPFFLPLMLLHLTSSVGD